MKVLILNGGYLTEVPSGGDRHLLQLASALSERHEVKCVLPGFARPLLESPEVRAMSYRAIVPGSLAGILLTYVSRTIKASMIACRTPAEVLLSSPGLFDLVPALIHKKRYGARVGVYVFHIGERKAMKGLSKKIQAAISSCAQGLSLWMLKGFADVTFTSNQPTRLRLIERGFAEDRVVVQLPAVNKAAVQGAEPVEAPDLLFVGRLVEKKGIFDLVEAVRYTNLSVGIVGEGEDRKSLQDRIDRYQLGDRVELLGSLSDESLYSLLRGCKCFVFPSYEEGYGIAIAEAILAGKPVIAYELLHYREVFGEALITVPVGDVRALGEAIRKFSIGELDLRSRLETYEHVHIFDAKQAAAFELDKIMSV